MSEKGRKKNPESSYATHIGKSSKRTASSFELKIEVEQINQLEHKHIQSLTREREHANGLNGAM